MKRPKAFTLLELLVVIAIIAGLIAIMVPSISKARKRANLVRCMANERRIISFYKQWERPKDHFQSDINILTDVGLNVGKALICPETRIRSDYGSGDASTAWKLFETTGVVTGLGRPANLIDGSYGGNGWLIEFYDAPTMQHVLKGSIDTPYHFCDRSKIFDEATIPAFFDAMLSGAFPVATDVIPVKDRPLSMALQAQMGAIAFRRHGSVTNVAFWDGHVENVKLPDLWTLRWNRNWTPHAPYPVPASWNGMPPSF
jgi:prepilin-type N-terminal cleavage/methylation domain-containing protein/prepilin-type processing-associated H-X9-DG protein